MLLSASAQAAIVEIVNMDGIGEGMNDPTPVAPAPGNPATSLGEARRLALQAAADIWGACLESTVPIVVKADFKPLYCAPQGSNLGSSAPSARFVNFSAAAPYPAPLPSVYHYAALANAIHGAPVGIQGSDLTAEFNSSIDFNTNCEAGDLYYGLSGVPPPNAIDAVTVFMHEMGHGLGLSSLVNKSTGSNGGDDDVYTLHVEHHGFNPPMLSDMSDAQRLASLQADPDLHWAGPNTTVAINANPPAIGVSNGHLQLAQGSHTHLHEDLDPNELMEPYLVTPVHTPGLAAPMLQDTGWRLEGEQFWMQDHPLDSGAEPNPTLSAPWLSEDIWLRNFADSSVGARSAGPIYEHEGKHESALYKAVGDNFVYVRIRKKGCGNELPGGAKLKLYWSKSGTAQTWDSQWVGYQPSGNINPNNVLFGDLIGEVTIPAIPSGEVWVAEIPWKVPAPSDYPAWIDPNQFCLLARIETDPQAPYGMTTPEGSNVKSNTLANNDIIWKNINVYEFNPNAIQKPGQWTVNNPLEIPELFDIELRPAPGDEDLLERASIEIELDPQLDEDWRAEGAESEGLVEVAGTRRLRMQAGADGSWLRGVPLAASDIRLVTIWMQVQDGPAEAHNWSLDSTQYSSSTGEALGGVRMEIRWNPELPTPTVPGLSDGGGGWLLFFLAAAGALRLRRRGVVRTPSY